MKRLTALLAAALVLFAWPCEAAIAVSPNMGTANTASTVTTLDLVTLIDAPAGAAIIGVVNLTGSATGLTVTDSASTPNTYGVPTKVSNSTAGSGWLFHADNPIDLPAPCTVTATETSTTLVVTAVVTCSSTDAITVGQTISGGSFTGKISAPCTLVAGSATCTITGGATVASPATATISSTITATWTTGGKAGMGAVSVSGLATSSPLDVNGVSAVVTGTGTGAGPSTGTLAQASEIVFGRVDTAGTNGGLTQTGWTPLTTVTITGGNNVIGWGYQIVANSNSVTYTTTWGTSRVYFSTVYSFKAPGGAAAAKVGMLLGVGP